MDRDVIRIDSHPKFGVRQTLGGLNGDEDGLEPNREKQKRCLIVEVAKRVSGVWIPWIQISNRGL
jgi:hypothetical protein